MKHLPLPLIAIAIFLVAAMAIAAALKGRSGRPETFATRRKPIATSREQAMYWRLKEAFPDAVVLTQVAFSALITSERAHRNRYDRKVADFVLCDRSFTVTAVIELDDASHTGREDADAARAALLERAGYRFMRFAQVPDVQPLRAKLALPSPTAPPVAK